MQSRCRLVRPLKTYAGKQGFDYFEGVASETTDAREICMHLLTIPPGGRAKAHMHEHHETAICGLSGETGTYWEHQLENQTIVQAGDMFYIQAGLPPLPANLGDQLASAVIARTDPREQESVVLLQILRRSCRTNPVVPRTLVC
jgi:uncharacterized RmlC-like cupin family protein